MGFWNKLFGGGGESAQNAEAQKTEQRSEADRSRADAEARIEEKRQSTNYAEGHKDTREQVMESTAKQEALKNDLAEALMAEGVEFDASEAMNMVTEDEYSRLAGMSGEELQELSANLVDRVKEAVEDLEQKKDEAGREAEAA